MKRRPLLALVGLTLSFALPTFAQRNDTATDPQTSQAYDKAVKAYDEAVNHNDAAAVGALYTEDAVFVSDRGPVYGRQALEKWYQSVFQSWHPQNHVSTTDGNALHLIDSAGKVAWQTGAWSETGQGPGGNASPLKGYWGAVYLRDGGAWKIRMLTFNITPAPAVTGAAVPPSSQ